MNKKCKHPIGAWASRGRSSGPDKENNFSLYDCLICGTRFRYYPSQERVEELPKMGLVTAMLYENPEVIV